MSHLRGLTLGKYAPLHKGHQLVIETALAEVDELVVLIYDSPEVTEIPLPVRADWIRHLYPEVRVIEAWDGPSRVGSDPELKAEHEDYIINRLGIKGITHFYSSEFYGEHMSRALGAVNRVVDKNRRTHPLSATGIRHDPYRHRESIDRVVYRDLVSNIVFLGAPCTGKTTLAQHLAALYQTVWMPEYGREFWEQNQTDRRLTPEQLVSVASEHLAREEALLAKAKEIMFTDTNALTTRIFAHYYHGAALPELEDLADLVSNRYDLVFLCGTDMPYSDTWDRSGPENRDLFQKMIISDLRTRRIPFFLLEGNLDERTSKVRAILARYRKYMNYNDLLEP